MREQGILFMSIFFICLSNTILPNSLKSKIFVTSIPKCGTHLLTRCIDLLLPAYPRTVAAAKDNYILLSEDLDRLALGGMYVGHVPCVINNRETVSKPNIKGFFIYRDPRDFLVSAAYWVKRFPQFWPHYESTSINKIIIELMSDYSKVCVLTAQAAPGDINNFYKYYLPWQECPNVYTTTFEKLVGPQGGGDALAQMREIQNIAHHLDIKVDENKCKEVAKNLFGNSFSFREGKIGAWRRCFTEECCVIFKEIAGRLLIDLGYEKDLNWLSDLK